MSGRVAIVDLPSDSFFERAFRLLHGYIILGRKLDCAYQLYWPGETNHLIGRDQQTRRGEEDLFENEDPTKKPTINISRPPLAFPSRQRLQHQPAESSVSAATNPPVGYSQTLSADPSVEKISSVDPEHLWFKEFKTGQKEHVSKTQAASCHEFTVEESTTPPALSETKASRKGKERAQSPLSRTRHQNAELKQSAVMRPVASAGPLSFRDAVLKSLETSPQRSNHGSVNQTGPNHNNNSKGHPDLKISSKRQSNKNPQTLGDIRVPVRSEQCASTTQGQMGHLIQKQLESKPVSTFQENKSAPWTAVPTTDRIEQQALPTKQSIDTNKFPTPLNNKKSAISRALETTQIKKPVKSAIASNNRYDLLIDHNQTDANTRDHQDVEDEALDMDDTPLNESDTQPLGGKQPAKQKKQAKKKQLVLDKQYSQGKTSSEKLTEPTKTFPAPTDDKRMAVAGPAGGKENMNEAPKAIVNTVTCVDAQSGVSEPPEMSLEQPGLQQQLPFKHSEEKLVDKTRTPVTSTESEEEGETTLKGAQDAHQVNTRCEKQDLEPQSSPDTSRAREQQQYLAMSILDPVSTSRVMNQGKEQLFGSDGVEDGAKSADSSNNLPAKTDESKNMTADSGHAARPEASLEVDEIHQLAPEPPDSDVAESDQDPGQPKKAKSKKRKNRKRKKKSKKAYPNYDDENAPTLEELGTSAAARAYIEYIESL